MKRLALVLTALLLAIAALSLAAGEWLTRPVRQTIGAPPADLGAEAIDLRDGRGQRVAGWFVPGRPGHGAVLLLHGVRGNRLQMLARARWLQREGIASLAIDLAAHGDSEGERITFGRHEAAGVSAALAWLRQRLPDERVGAIGVSLGGAAVLFAAPRPALSALVLESVYPDIRDAVRDRLAMHLGPAGAALAPLLLVQLPLRLGLEPAELRPAEAITALRTPLLVAAGTDDQHTPWAETQQLFDAAGARPKALWPVPGAAHVDLHAHDPAAYEARLAPFMHRHLRKPPP